MTTGNIIALTIQIFVAKVMSLLFNMLSRFVIAFLPRNKFLFISWLEGTDTPLQYLFLPQEPYEQYEKTDTYDTGG